MDCYECFSQGHVESAVGLCHHCSAALCADHAVVLSAPVFGTEPLLKRIVFPKRARLLLCVTCYQALRQGSDLDDASRQVSSKRLPEPAVARN